MTDVEQEKVRADYGKVVAFAECDPAFKAKLLADTHGTLDDQGLPVPAGMTVKAVENTDKRLYLVVLPDPDAALSDEALDKVVGGCQVVTWDPRGEWISCSDADLAKFEDFIRNGSGPPPF